MSSDLAGFLDGLPEREVLPLRSIDIRLEEQPHPFEIENRAAIAAHWAKESRANPALFNGRMVLPLTARIADGILEGISRPIEFATFLFWRSRTEKEGGLHIFAHAVPISADGAIIAVRMAPHTANPGRIYCAAGSFEPEDFIGGRLDFSYNTHREVMEETGIDLGGVRHEAGYGLLRAGRTILVFRRYMFEETADAIAARIADHIARQTEHEIDQAVIIRADARPPNLTPHMHCLLDWQFRKTD